MAREPIMIVMARIHFRSAKPAETNPCKPTAIIIAQHSVSIVSQMMGLTFSNGRQKANTVPAANTPTFTNTIPANTPTFTATATEIPVQTPTDTPTP